MLKKQHLILFGWKDFVCKYWISFFFVFLYFFSSKSCIDNEETETLHLDIWDHDDESSVFEAMKKLNQIQNFKGLHRYFKQIAQSARTNCSTEGSHVDDFLGSVNLKINVYIVVEFFLCS